MDTWEKVGKVIASKYRVDVLNMLSNSDATPSGLANNSEHEIAHISRALGTLKDMDLVELLVPESTSKGRVYGITEEGERILEEMKDIEYR